jgi:ABC-2 type transport system ATP-binding protein
MKVGDQLIYLARLKGMSKSDSIDKVKHWIKKFEITEWWDKKIEDLSKGMQQKIQFISTVVHEPEILILDEPFSGFDPINANLIRDEILELREKGCSVIFSTHRMESVEELCEHIVLINNAEKILDGSKNEIKEAYRSHTYDLEYKGSELKLNPSYEIMHSQKEINGHLTVRIKDHSKLEPNLLIKALLEQVDIISFSERIPSMNDIFISKVQEEVSHV